LKKWVSKEFGINYAAGSLYSLVHRIGFSLQRPKKQCRNANPEEQTLVENTDDDTVILRVIFGACNPKTREVI